MQPSQQEPFVVTVIPVRPAPETTVADVIVGSMGVTGALFVLALLLGVLVAGLRVLWNRVHPPADDHLPPVTEPPSSSQARSAS